MRFLSLIMKVTSLLFLCAGFVLGCGYSKKGKSGKDSGPSGKQNRIVYGEDGRQDYFETTDAQLLKLAKSTVALIDKDDLIFLAAENIYKFRGTNEISMCPTEKFLKQPKVAYCSGALIAPDMILTAGHCVSDSRECQSVRFVFDYKLENPQTILKSVLPENTFRCAEIIKTIEIKNGADFALIRLDRNVPDREPLQLSDQEPNYHEPLMLIGHPAGLPTKFTLNGKVRSLIADQYFTASVDAFSGNSGSAVFDQQTGLILGVLSRGDQDYDRKNACYVAKSCGENDCRGEDVTRISEVKKYLPKNSF